MNREELKFRALRKEDDAIHAGAAVPSLCAPPPPLPGVGAQAGESSLEEGPGGHLL